MVVTCPIKTCLTYRYFHINKVRRPARYVSALIAVVNAVVALKRVDLADAGEGVTVAPAAADAKRSLSGHKSVQIHVGEKRKPR